MSPLPLQEENIQPEQGNGGVSRCEPCVRTGSAPGAWAPRPAYLVARVEAHVLVALLTVVVRVVRRILGQPHPRRLPPHEQVLRLPGGPSVCRRCQRYSAGRGPEETQRSSQRDKLRHRSHSVLLTGPGVFWQHRVKDLLHDSADQLPTKYADTVMQLNCPHSFQMT